MVYLQNPYVYLFLFFFSICHGLSSRKPQTNSPRGLLLFLTQRLPYYIEAIIFLSVRAQVLFFIGEQPKAGNFIFRVLKGLLFSVFEARVCQLPDLGFF
jgi:hypothetical protein